MVPTAGIFFVTTLSKDQSPARGLSNQLSCVHFKANTATYQKWFLSLFKLRLKMKLRISGAIVFLNLLRHRYLVNNDPRLSSQSFSKLKEIEHSAELNYFSRCNYFVPVIPWLPSFLLVQKRLFSISTRGRKIKMKKKKP